MKPIPELQFEAYTKAALRSERARLTWMLVAFGLVFVMGVFRVFVPVEGAERAGIAIIGLAVPFIVYEFFVRRMVTRRIADGRSMPVTLARLTLVIECCLPLAAIPMLVAVTGINPYTMLVSPAYAIILVILALSPLLLDPWRSITTGAVGSFGYLAIVIFVLARTDVPSPHPVAMYFTLTAVLIVATVAITFVTIEVRQYVIGTVRELETRRRNDQMTRDLELARDIQRGLLPESTPSIAGYDLAAISRAAELAGGDYYDWQLVGAERLVVTLADVTGHGVGPALVTAACRAYVRALVGEDPDPATIIDRVNDLLHEDLSTGRFVTFALIDLDASAHEGVFLSAGHGPSFWMSGEDGSAKSIDAQGLPLGIVDGQEWEEAHRLRFEAGDILVLFSDGFFETMNGDDEAFGLRRLEDVVRNNRHEPAAKIIERMDEALRTWQGARPQQDDMTAIAIKREA